MVSDLIEKLVYYAKLNLDLLEEDELYIKNSLYGILNAEYMGETKINATEIEKMQTPDAIINEIADYAEENLNIENRELFKTLIMGIVTPKPSYINNKFLEIENKDGSRRALDYFYNLCVKSDYVKKSAIDKNIFLSGEIDNKRLEMTINLSKPEKDNKEIAKAKEREKSKLVNKTYPKCMLCKENIGYYGRNDFPARQTLRYVPVTLNDEKWYMQYSPYAYYNQHSIIFSDEHTPMTVDKSTVRRCLDFLDRFGSYFIGSNACLPIIGGSILTHAHFQGGRYDMPLFSAKEKIGYVSSKYNKVKISYLDWFCNTLLLESSDKEEIIKLANNIISKYEDYSDESIDLISASYDSHNAITMISKKDGEDYKLYLIFRNNRVNDTFPDGIFHAHKERHNIKKEGIGLIEILGLFVLPPRLYREFNEINDILTSKGQFNIEEIDEKHSLFVHKDMIYNLLQVKSDNLDKEEADILIKNAALKICASILGDISVFKDSKEGIEALERFLKEVDIERR